MTAPACGWAGTVAEARSAAAGSTVVLDHVVILNTVDTVNSASNYSIQVADATGAITVFGSNADIGNLLSGDLQAGDALIGLQGVVGDFNGLRQLQAPFIREDYDYGVGLPEPITISVADVQTGSPVAEEYESQVVVLRGVAFTQAGQTFGSGLANYPIESGGHTALVRFATTEIASWYAGKTIPGGRLDVVAVLSQFDSTAPFNGDYQLLVVSPEAFTPSLFQDGAGSAVLRNSTPGAGLAQPGREMPVFQPGAHQNMQIEVTGESLGAITLVRVQVPEDWGLDAGFDVSLAVAALRRRRSTSPAEPSR